MNLFLIRIFAAGAVSAAFWLKDQSPGGLQIRRFLMDKGCKKMEAQEIIRLIQTASKKTPVKVYLKCHCQSIKFERK